MTDILTNDGVRSIEDLEKAEREFTQVPKVPIQKEIQVPKVVQRESNYLPLPQTKIPNNPIKEFNNNPNTKRAGVIAMKKGTYIGIWIFAGLVFLLLQISSIWFNVSFTKKDFNTNIPVNNNIDVPVNITNNYANTNQNNYTIVNNINNNITLIMPEDFLIKLVNETI